MNADQKSQTQQYVPIVVGFSGQAAGRKVTRQYFQYGEELFDRERRPEISNATVCTDRGWVFWPGHRRESDETFHYGEELFDRERRPEISNATFTDRGWGFWPGRRKESDETVLPVRRGAFRPRTPTRNLKCNSIYRSWLGFLARPQEGK